MKIEKRNGKIMMVDGDNEIVIEKIKLTSDGYLYLPDNSLNRKLVNYQKVLNLKDGEFIEMKSIEKSGIGSNSGRISQKSIIEYMSEEDKKVYEEIMKRAKEAYDKAHEKKELTPIEKAELAVKKAMEKLERLKNEA